MRFLLRLIGFILLLTALSCSEEKKEDVSSNFSPEGRAIMEKENLSDEQISNLKLVEIDYSKAPSEMRAIAYKIFLRQSLTQPDLKALGENINKSFPERKPNGLYRYGRTLLVTAVENQNLDAVNALLEAGADPYVSTDPNNESEQIRSWNFLYLAMKQEGQKLPDSDYFDKTYANQLLQLYLKHGGDPNYRWPDGQSLLEFTVGDNFEGFKILLQAGADPWKRGEQDTPLAVQCVTLMRKPSCIQYLAENGYYDKTPENYMYDMIDAATNELEAGARTDPEEVGQSYSEYGRYADAVKLLLQRSHYPLGEGSTLYRLLYVESGTYRKKLQEKRDGN
ncbi:MULTISPECIES: ankyrin repeat domain-containing protein [Rhizobium/Agrobacterium group]|uniref:Uncharacterized protein n=3 Tax=Rhizobiaceae TaxID=82115 RepID=B9K5L7_ALLAM|nr:MULTISPECIES: ankyrin repeat domain-containing protein [Rhizobium/Agrobacterium group]ACM40165.1 hypothetical protein Avi_7558 [Allorhizobium ampelinum S4]MCF1449097.1 ankyrin repeat domain-containing protein [Allorhizobium ampelinum]MUO28362.1 ankyrin repeat domain-containing protein [Agrobacterium vitis]MUO41245.1 ankyrin repeat domain-containing protein [Agrobacterium vitis]MUP08849.1 ankyrin repeat domain-containing protein [Agrobacterium vitis]